MADYCSVQQLCQQQHEDDANQHAIRVQAEKNTHHQQSDFAGSNVKSGDAVSLAVNPGRLAKGCSGGTFAHIWINNSSLNENDVASRYKVEIRRV